MKWDTHGNSGMGLKETSGQDAAGGKTLGCQNRRTLLISSLKKEEAGKRNMQKRGLLGPKERLSFL